MNNVLPLFKRASIVLLTVPLLGGCEQLMDRLEIANPKKIQAEGMAIGSACRHAGRGLEDCYRLNPEANKPAVFEGWREMNEYMMKNNMQAVPSLLPPPFAAMTPPPTGLASPGPAEAASASEPSAETRTADGKGSDGKAASGKPSEAKSKVDKPSGV